MTTTTKSHPWEETWNCNVVDGQVCVEASIGEYTLCLGIYDEKPRDLEIGNLIAAAPELYRAVHALLNAEEYGQRAEAVFLAVRAIEKARGKK